ncbi:MAG: long-chain fatty acid--CoA ligase, partial [Flavobacterium sp.]
AVLYTDKNIDKELIKGVLKEKLSLHTSSLKVIHMHDLPLTANGKVNYPMIKEWLESESLVQ